ncbi:MAG: hypothetical protein CMM45_07795 [Rhodospirillaceae bacterium]|nr:hypothetical protein [Rhodospirillaceae bacterium]
MDDEQHLIQEIESYCNAAGIAESTFGRQAVNDGKFVGRLRAGKSITMSTVAKVRQFLKDRQRPLNETHVELPQKKSALDKSRRATPIKKLQTQQANPLKSPKERQIRGREPEKRQFRFYDNRQKYLLFVNTCSEKWAVAERVGMELGHIHPKPPALRIFDAGMGDGTVLTNVMRQMHRRFPNFPFHIVGKEISLEDVRLGLEKMPDRFHEHPATVLIVTNLYYTEAPWLAPRSMEAAAALNWIEVPLSGTSSHAFHEQIKDLQPILVDGWQVKSSNKTGNPLYERPSVLVLYREDHKFLLDRVIPRIGQAKADHDLIIASQPYRARMPVEFKVEKVIAPLSKALAPGGRLLGVHSYGRDPGLEIIQKIWPEENPFVSNRHDILKTLKTTLGKSRRDLNFNAYSDKRALFQYVMHTLPSEISNVSIGTSTLFAAWNAAIYVAQIEDERLEPIIQDVSYLQATREVLSRYSGLWFNDESFVVSRKRD